MNCLETDKECVITVFIYFNTGQQSISSDNKNTNEWKADKIVFNLIVECRYKVLDKKLYIFFGEAFRKKKQWI